MTQKISTNKVVAISYKLSTSEGKSTPTLVENVDEAHPMYILVGSSGLPPLFEAKIEGLTIGDNFRFTLEAADAFGTFDDSEVMNLPVDDFKDESGKFDDAIIKEGAILPMVDETGHEIRGFVVEVNKAKGYVKMNFNHPLAGKDLHFEGKVLQVRDALPEELDHGHVHGEGGHHH